MEGSTNIIWDNERVLGVAFLQVFCVGSTYIVQCNIVPTQVDKNARRRQLYIALYTHLEEC